MNEPDPEKGPDLLDLDRARELRGRQQWPWARRFGVAMLVAFLILALLNVFGQRQTTSRASTVEATVQLTAPAALRSGLIYQVHVTIVAGTRGIDGPKLVLGRGWFDGMTINTVEPAPSSEVARDGRIVLAYDPLDASQRMDVFIEGQVNPTTVGRKNWDLEVDDGTVAVARLHRDVRVFP